MTELCSHCHWNVKDVKGDYFLLGKHVCISVSCSWYTCNQSISLVLVRTHLYIAYIFLTGWVKCLTRLRFYVYVLSLIQLAVLLKVDIKVLLLKVISTPSPSKVPKLNLTKLSLIEMRCLWRKFSYNARNKK
jgi:hypothetical protein